MNQYPISKILPELLRDLPRSVESAKGGQAVSGNTAKHFWLELAGRI